VVLIPEDLLVFELALHLGKTVRQLSEEMSYEEFLGWINYFEQRPYGWRDDDRAAKLMQAQGVKEKPWKIFSSLDAIYHAKPVNKDPNMISAANLKASPMFRKMLGAKGGDKLEIFND
jgi:hypothetical protein